MKEVSTQTIVSTSRSSKRNRIENQVDKPVWPAEGSIAVINNVIVINFGITDIVFNEHYSYFLAMHWVSEGRC